MNPSLPQITQITRIKEKIILLFSVSIYHRFNVSPFQCFTVSMFHRFNVSPFQCFTVSMFLRFNDLRFNDLRFNLSFTGILEG
ncbi:MAG: hypothetical protein WCI31_08590, partial [Prolixibacteraceae bacterium]